MLSKATAHSNMITSSAHVTLCSTESVSICAMRGKSASQSEKKLIVHNPVNIYLFKFNNRNTRTRWEICSKLTIKIPERRQWRRSGVFINFEHILHLALMFLLLTLNM